VSLNDRFYSGNLTWISGLASYTIDSTDTIAIAGGGNLSDESKSTLATPLAQNNSSIFDVIYTYSSGPLTISPYLQYSRITPNPGIGLDRGAETYGAAALARYTFTDNFSLTGRAEYIKASGGDCGSALGCNPVNVLYGPNSAAWSLTLTPTYQHGIFFARTEISYTKIDNLTAGFGFGSDFDRRDKFRGMLETGILF
jgi:hypothetical protein